MSLSSSNDKSLMNVIDMISSDDSPDCIKIIGEQQAAILSIASFLDSLSACAKSGSSIHDMEEQIDFHNVNITTDSLTVSPTLLAPILTTNLTQNNNSSVFNNLLNVKNNISTPEASSEDVLTATPPTICTYSPTNIQHFSNERLLVNSIVHGLSNSPKSIIIPTPSNEPVVQTSSQQINITGLHTESSITITSEFFSFIA